ncbi:hypothetical protein Hdeb2414_s0963g00969001 [Helianthus debilis subsp. tardiflorus]
MPGSCYRRKDQTFDCTHDTISSLLATKTPGFSSLCLNGAERFVTCDSNAFASP